MSSQAIQTLSRIDYSSKCVLVVDDFHQHLQFMAKALKRIGFHNIQLAHNPREALKAAEEFNFDIVFCDYNMGDGKNGQQLLQELRYFKKVRYDCIFIMISAETSREVVLGAIESEPEGYIAKPFNEAMLRRKIDRLMDKQACLRSINRAIEDEEYDSAIDQCYISAERHPRYQAWCMKKAAELHLRQGQYAHAQEVYRGVLEERVLDWALMGLARTFMYKGKYRDAINELKQVLTLNNNCVPAYDLLAECYQQLGDFQAAKEQLMSAAKLSPNSVNRQELLGDACAMNSDFENATQAYKAAVKASRHSIEETPEGYFKLAGAITDSMAGDMSKQDSNKLVEEAISEQKAYDEWNPDTTTEEQPDTAEPAAVSDPDNANATPKPVASDNNDDDNAADNVEQDTAEDADDTLSANSTPATSPSNLTRKQKKRLRQRAKKRNKKKK